MATNQVVLSGVGATGMTGHLLSVTSNTPPSLTVKLGRIRQAPSLQLLSLKTYIEPSNISTPPDTVDYTKKATASLSQMYKNDEFGDCVIAGKYHAEGVWSGNDTDSGGVVLGTDAEVLTAYQTICGPGDNGCIITQVLDYYRDKGLKFNGSIRKIDGYVRLDWTNKLEVQVAIYIFGAVSIGINFPDSWRKESIWDITTSQIIGGHDVTCVGYNSQGVQVSSWGRIYTMTWAAFLSEKWIDEAYVMLSPDWYGNDKVAPSGIDLIGLRKDLEKIGQGVIPSVNPSPNPPITKVFANIGDVFYAVAADSSLLWYHHLGHNTGTLDWQGPNLVGSKWT